MLRRERLPVHLVGQEHLVPQRLPEPEAPRVALGLAGLEPAVEPVEHDLDGVPRNACLLEERPQRRPAPPRRADRFGEPRLARRPRVEERPPVSGALHRRGELEHGPRAEVVEREIERPLAANGDPPRLRVDVRHVVVDQEVVQAERRDRVAQRLERQPVVSRRELQLLERDAHAARLTHALARHGWSSVTRHAAPSRRKKCRSCSRSSWCTQNSNVSGARR